jgi:hypothetical protein
MIRIDENDGTSFIPKVCSPGPSYYTADTKLKHDYTSHIIEEYRPAFQTPVTLGPADYRPTDPGRVCDWRSRSFFRLSPFWSILFQINTNDHDRVQIISLKPFDCHMWFINCLWSWHFGIEKLAFSATGNEWNSLPILKNWSFTSMALRYIHRLFPILLLIQR